MRRRLICAVCLLVGFSSVARGGEPSCSRCQPHRIAPPPPSCPDCCGPCTRRCCLTPFGPEHAQKYIAQLCDGTCCDKLKAIHKLGSRLHVDLCRTPSAADALVAALLGDPCWEVRQAAASALLWQQAPLEPVLMALHVSSKLDPHYMVRAKSAEALDILTLCRTPCYTALVEAADHLVQQLRAEKIVPGTPAMPTALPPPVATPANEPTAVPERISTPLPVR